MRNYIDKLFFDLIAEFKIKTEDELYLNMKNKFCMLDGSTKDGIQDFLNKFGYWGELDVKTGNYEVFRDKARVFKRRVKDFVWLYNRLCDYKSKYVLFSVLNNYYNFDFINLYNATTRDFKQYFDIDLMKNAAKEVYVDVGAYTGDSALDFINSFGETYKNIYLFEITKNILAIAKDRTKNYENIIFKNVAVSNKKGFGYLEENKSGSSANCLKESGSVKIEKVTLDSEINEKIDVIKMDIEGGEANALKGAKMHIKRDSPTLLIAIYHGNKDIVRIPRLINKLNPNYNFYIRYHGGNIYATEIDLVCIKKENEV